MDESHKEVRPRPLAGIYAITPDADDTPRLIAAVAGALAGGVRWIQYRNKSAPPGLRSLQAKALKRVCDAYGSALIINDDVALACEIDATGVHLGAGDGDIAAARDTLGASRILGVSCYASVAQAHAAEQAGANYVAFGSVFSSPTKPLAKRAALSLFNEARAEGVKVPLVGIGGIDSCNLDQLINANASAAAIIAAIFMDLDPVRVEDRAAALTQRFPA